MATDSTHYYLPAPSRWPVTGSTALFIMAISAVLLVNGIGTGWIVLAVGAGMLVSAAISVSVWALNRPATAAGARAPSWLSQDSTACSAVRGSAMAGQPCLGVECLGLNVGQHFPAE